jgi:hypothetical protein
MTMNEATAIDTILEEEIGATEELPHDAIAEVERGDINPELEAILDKVTPIKFEQPAVRHLAPGSSTKTLCGLDRKGQDVAHPSKAKKTDCNDCRQVLRESMQTKTLPPIDKGAAFRKGDRIGWEDGSVWIVDDLRDGGADLTCILGSVGHPKGRKTTISKDALVRVLDDGAFKDAEEAAKPKVETTDGAKATAPRNTGKWQPTKADVAKVKELRILGHNYRQIEGDMNWPAGNGNRPWKCARLTAEQIALLKD